ncbi:hypothetical protein JTB14_026439 [Gonioctena quinquepunctata]|nr:hypothetical protein JTB14_026439 [Gonioctena quinquepunctata]
MPNSSPVSQEISLAGILDFLKRLDQKFDKSQETLAEIKVELQSVCTKVSILEEENYKLKKEIQNLDRKQRRNNIVVFGIETKDKLESLSHLSDTLEVPIKLSDTDNIYSFETKNNKRIIKIELLSYWKKIDIQKNVYKLKNKNIFVANDLSPEDQIIHKNLRSHLNTAKNHDIKASIRNNKLIIKITPIHLRISRPTLTS